MAYSLLREEVDSFNEVDFDYSYNPSVKFQDDIDEVLVVLKGKTIDTARPRDTYFSRFLCGIKNYKQLFSGFNWFCFK